MNYNQIYIDNNKDLEERFELVFERIKLINNEETVEENLTLGRKISPDIFDKSIRIACADDFVFNKLDTVYDKNLSGGLT